MKNHLVLLAATAVSAVGIAACGSSGHTGTSTANSKKAAAPATGGTGSPSGSPIKLITIGPVNAPGFSLPSIPTGAQVAVTQINSAGGVNGHPLQLITCNDQNNPNTATQCAREAIQDKVAAVVGGLSLFDLKIIPYLQQAQIPWVGETTPDAYTQPNMFLLGGEGADGYAAVGMALAEHGCKKIAVVRGAESPAVNDQYIEAGIRAVGGAAIAGQFSAPATGSDWAPTVAAIRAAGADCIGSSTGPPETGPLLDAINAGPKITFALATGGLPSTVLKQLGAGANGVLGISGYYPFSTKKGAVQFLAHQIAVRYPGVPLDGTTASGYAAVRVTAEAAKGLKDVTGSAMMSALTKIKDFNTGVGPVVSFTKPNSIPGFSRVFNANNYLWIAKNGVWQLAQPQPINATPALKILSSEHAG